MVKDKNFTLFFEYFTREHFGKDPFLVPYYIGKALGYTVTIIFPEMESNRDLPPELKGVKLLRLPLRGTEHSNHWVRYSEFYKYIWKNAPSIDVFMRFFDIPLSRASAIVYKMRNPQGKCYIKMDVDPMNIDKDFKQENKILNFPGRVKLKLFDKISKYCVDVITCETKLAYDKLTNSRNIWNRWGDKLAIMPNGIDEELFSSFQLKEKKFGEKANVMITVSRLGTPQKNTPMLLRALEKVDLKDWTFYLIGSIDESLKPEIDSFYMRNPEKKHLVIFTGPVNDKKELCEFYNKSKVFVLTSRFEGFALVFNEARRFSNYLVTTPVGAYADVLENGKYGDVVGLDDSEELAKKLQDIVNGKTNVDVYGGFDRQSLSWENYLKIVVDRLQ